MTDVNVGPTDTDGVLTSWHSYSAGRYKRRAVGGPQLVLLGIYVLPYISWPSLWLGGAMGLISDKWVFEVV